MAETFSDSNIRSRQSVCFAGLEIKVKRRFLILMLCILLLVPFPVQAAEPDTIPGNESVLGGSFVPSDAPEITGTTAIVMDMDTGDILYEKDCHKRAEPASTTKLLTAILAVDNLNPSDVITVKDGALEGISYDAVRIWLSPGETMPVSDLLYALLLPSANDAANVLAMAVAGTIPNFATKMNETAKALGCKDTHFVNANGLPDPQHYTTAYDMALIARAAYGRSRIRDVLGTPAYWIPATNMAEERELWTTNYLLYDVTDVYYEYCTGGKTGYTEEAGNCMVAFAEKYGRRLVSVVFHCPGQYDRFTDSKNLLEFCFEEYHRIHPLEGFNLEEYDENGSDQTDSKGGLGDVVLENYYARLTHALPEYSVDTSLSLYTRSSVSTDDIQKQISFQYDKYKMTAGELRLSFQNRTLASIPIRIDRTEMDADLADLAALGPEERLRTDGKAELPATRSEILQSVIEDSVPRLLICIGVAMAVCIIVILAAHMKKTRRANISRYFGDGPVPAIDPEAVREAEERKKAREALRQLEDSGEGVSRPKVPREKPPTDDGIEDTGERTPRKPAEASERSAVKPDAKPISEMTIDELEDTGERSPKKSAEKSSGSSVNRTAPRNTKKPADNGIDDVIDEG